MRVGFNFQWGNHRSNNTLELRNLMPEMHEEIFQYPG